MKYELDNKVKIRLRLNVSSDRFKSLMTLYRQKFSSFMSYCLSVQFTQYEYSRLPEMREYLNNTHINDVLMHISFSQISQDNRRRLIDIFPVFSVCPIELKAYILVALGFTLSDK